MDTVVGIFDSGDAALEAVRELHDRGISADAIHLVMPGGSLREFERWVHADDPGAAQGAWSALGLGMGSFAGAAFVSAIIPGIGPVLGIGALAAAFVAGGVAGMKAGEAIDRARIHDDQHDDTRLFEEALRLEKAVVAVEVRTDSDANVARETVRVHRGDSFDQAHTRWWSTRVTEMKSEPSEVTGPLDSTHREWAIAASGGEPAAAPTSPLPSEQQTRAFDRGFAAAQEPRFEGRTYDEVAIMLRAMHTDQEEPYFRRGYERARAIALRGVEKRT